MKNLCYKFMESSFSDILFIAILGFLLNKVGDMLIAATGSLTGYIMCVGIFGISFWLGMKLSIYIGRKVDKEMNKMNDKMNNK